MQSEATAPRIASPSKARSWAKGLMAGVGGVVAGGAVSFALFALIGPATIYNDALQSAKMQAVWGEIEPLPLINSNPALFGAVIALLGGIHGLVFVGIVNGLPTTIIRRGVVFGAIIWSLAYLFFEVNGPWALLGEPVPLVGVELTIQLVGALVQGIVISAIYGKT